MFCLLFVFFLYNRCKNKLWCFKKNQHFHFIDRFSFSSMSLLFLNINLYRKRKENHFFFYKINDKIHLNVWSSVVFLSLFVGLFIVVCLFVCCDLLQELQRYIINNIHHIIYHPRSL